MCKTGTWGTLRFSYFSRDVRGWLPLENAVAQSMFKEEMVT
jgi:hypothetical protein